ncbi:uncharacterized protein LOC134275133 [Saccostrea cucullata]|uniref:uncharacterized protein LOC134275133 n=1 Tax=Saccostrea cuccullata TaxID=36930 RepID=UPI002ED08275
MRCINNFFKNIDTRGTKYHECTCHGNPDIFQLTINDIESSVEGVYRLELKLPNSALESKNITVYVLNDINAIGKDELNFLRYKECDNIAKEALRITFERYLHQSGTDLATHLAGYQNHLISIKKLNPYQIEILYPSDGSLVSTRTFDVSILYTLLRNTTSIKKPKNNWNHEPPLESIDKADDVERIHLFRNLVAHCTNKKLSDDEFEEKWFDLSTAIDRLSKGKLRKPLCQLRNKRFEQQKVSKEKLYRRQNFTDPYTEIISKWQLQDKLFCKELRLVEKKV